VSDDLGIPLCLTEGPETGLSVWAATGHETWIALGGMGNHEPPANRPVVVCRDDDPLQSPADKALTRALALAADCRIASFSGASAES
jgi:putative DNA primase/helicase